MKKTMINPTVMVAIMVTSINDLEQTFVLSEQRSYLNNTLEEMNISPVKAHSVHQHLCRIVSEEKYTKPKSCVDTFAIKEDNLSYDKSCVRDENALILEQKADDLDRLMSLVKQKTSPSKIQLLTLGPESWTITQAVTKLPCVKYYMTQQSWTLLKEKELLAIPDSKRGKEAP